MAFSDMGRLTWEELFLMRLTGAGNAQHSAAFEFWYRIKHLNGFYCVIEYYVFRHSFRGCFVEVYSARYGFPAVLA